ncbi:MAG: ATP-binding protein, partial [Clostridium sp.]|nr:ATP-binding protein [Clostridium sp.]
LDAYGDGMKKAMLLISAVLKAKDGILLLDEFETAIHISAMEHVFHFILQVAMKNNVQIFMTSHSLEAIETTLKCIPEYQKQMRMITLVKVEDEIRARNVDGEKAVQLLDEYGLELR